MDIEEIADRLYEAAIIPELMPKVMDEMSAIAGAEGAVLFAVSDYVAQWCSSESIRHHIFDFIAMGLPERNERAAKLVASGYMGFVRDRDFFTEQEMDQMEVYRDFLRPRGYGWGAATYVPVPNGDSIVLSLERKFVHGPVPVEALRQLDLLRPHFARAALIASRLRLQRASDTVALLERFGIPAAVLGMQGKVIACNAAFEGLAPQITSGSFDRLQLRDGTAQDQLKSALDDGKLFGDQPMRSIVVPATEEQAALVVHLAPVRRQAHDFFSNGAFLAIATPASASPLPGPIILNALYDLTPAESRIASKLIDGQSIEGIALAMGLSKETVRTHSKRVYNKTGSRNQAELTARLSPLRVKID